MWDGPESAMWWQMRVLISSVHVLQGCYEKAREFVGEQADILVGCAFTFAFSVVGIQYLDFFVTISVSD